MEKQIKNKQTNPTLESIAENWVNIVLAQIEAKKKSNAKEKSGVFQSKRF